MLPFVLSTKNQKNEEESGENVKRAFYQEPFVLLWPCSIHVCRLDKYSNKQAEIQQTTGQCGSIFTKKKPAEKGNLNIYLKLIIKQ